MMTYAMAFLFYTLAMIGILLIGFIVYKKTFQPNAGGNKGYIKVIDSLPIGNKKHLLIVKIGGENFLIASGLEHTTFLAKLGNNSSTSAKKIQEKVITPEVIDGEALKEFYSQNSQPQKEIRFDDYVKTRNTKTQEIQNQFKALYEQEHIPQRNSATQNRKDAIKQLLKEGGLNTRNGSSF